MVNNVSLKQLAECIGKADSALIFPHVNPDGDALGSAVALCLALRKQGKRAWVLTEEEVPEYISFIEYGCCTRDKTKIQEPDLCICVDCSETKRFSAREEAFNKGRKKLCIDHHLTPEGLGDGYYIDPDEAATAQIIYKLLRRMDVEIDRDMAKALYVGISTDTGSFQYSNTTGETHRIVAELFQAGLDHMDATLRLYQTVSRQKVRLEAEVLKTMEIFAEGRGSIAYVTKEMMKTAGAGQDDAEGMVDVLRNIEGVEIAAFLKERDDGVKVSLRAKSRGDVDAIAREFGGGGHVKAAGCTLKMTMTEAVGAIKRRIIEGLSE